MHPTGPREVIDEPERFFGRPVLLHWKLCGWVKIAGMDGTSQETRQGETVALERQKLSPEDLWWFHTGCDACQILLRS